MDPLIVIDDGISDGTPLVSRMTRASDQSSHPHHEAQARDELHHRRRTDLLEHLKSDLSLLQIDTSAIDASDFQWLPKNGFDYRKLDNMRACPILTTNEDLADILDLQLSTPDSPPLPAGMHYYSRACSFRQDELQAVIRYMKNDDYFSQETRMWQGLLDANRNEPATIYTIRYIGSVQGPRRPIDRYQDDLDLRTSGLLAEFSRAVSAVCPRVDTEAEIFLIRGASMHETASSERKENVERILIAFFDHASLLNRQAGGYLVSYVPARQDIEAFGRLNTDVGARFGFSSTFSPSNIEDSLDQHFIDLQTYANANPEICGTARHFISDELRRVMLKQALPQQYRDQTLVVFIGKDAPIEIFMSPTPFLSRGIHAGGFVDQILDSIAGIEASTHGRAVSLETTLPYKDLFCIVDLWPWLKHDHLGPAAKYLRSYLQIVKPLVVPVFGRQTSDLVLSNLDADCDRRLQSLTPVVATPSIQYYDWPDEGDMHDPDAAFIAVPALHPGTDKHYSHAQPLRRLTDLSLKYVFSMLHVTMNILDEEKVFPSRFALCHEIIRRTETITGDGQDFSTYLALSKVEVESVLRQSMTRSETEDARSMFSQEAYQTLISFGLAEGEPESSERDIQVERLWLDNISQLHLVVPHQLDQKKQWKDQFMKLRPRQSLLLAALTGMDPDMYENAIMSLLKPHWQLPGSWLEDAHHTITFGLWKRSDGKVFTITLNLPTYAIPKRVSETRALVYTPLGIDLVDGQGQVFLKQRSGTKTATLPKQALLSHEVTKQLWLEVLQAHNIDPQLEEEPDDGPAQEWGPKGVAMLSARARSVTPRQNSPPHRTDGIYPLYAFIEQEFPQGGNYDLAFADKYRGSKEHTKALVRFLKTPAFRKHPFAANWLEKLDRPTPSLEMLKRNLPLLRNVKRLEATGTSKVVQLAIGPPGSAVSNPFDIQHEQCSISEAKLDAWKKNGKEIVSDEGPTTKKRTSKYPTKGAQERSKQRK
ncbi:hypothetical protein KCU78_g1641, partial [Aureobasidium melanogenum]